MDHSHAIYMTRVAHDLVSFLSQTPLLQRLRLPLIVDQHVYTTALQLNVETLQSMDIHAYYLAPFDPALLGLCTNLKKLVVRCDRSLHWESFEQGWELPRLQSLHWVNKTSSAGSPVPFLLQCKFPALTELFLRIEVGEKVATDMAALIPRLPQLVVLRASINPGTYAVVLASANIRLLDLRYARLGPKLVDHLRPSVTVLKITLGCKSDYSHRTSAYGKEPIWRILTRLREVQTGVRRVYVSFFSHEEEPLALSWKKRPSWFLASETRESQKEAWATLVGRFLKHARRLKKKGISLYDSRYQQAKPATKPAS
jgi:hypothetical protein